MARKYTEEELKNLAKTPYEAFGDWLASAFSPSGPSQQPKRIQGGRGPMGRLSVPPADIASDPYSSRWLKAYQHEFQPQAEGVMPYTPFGQQTAQSDFLTGTNWGSHAIGASKAAQESGLGASSEGPSGQSSSTPLGNGSAQNTAQRGEDESDYMQEALKSVMNMYQGNEGVPIKGSSNIRVRSDVYGRPYTTVNVSARDDQGRFKESTEFDLAGRPVKTRGAIEEGMQGTDFRKYEQPVTYANPTQAREIERRKQVTIGGGSPMLEQSESPDMSVGSRNIFAGEASPEFSRKWDKALKKDIEATKKKYKNSI